MAVGIWKGRYIGAVGNEGIGEEEILGAEGIGMVLGKGKLGGGSWD